MWSSHAISPHGTRKRPGYIKVCEDWGVETERAWPPDGSSSPQGAPAVTGLPDRFLHHADIIEITGRRDRLKDKARRSEKATCT